MFELELSQTSDPDRDLLARFLLEDSFETHRVMLVIWVRFEPIKHDLVFLGWPRASTNLQTLVQMSILVIRIVNYFEAQSLCKSFNLRLRSHREVLRYQSWIVENFCIELAELLHFLFCPSIQGLKLTLKENLCRFFIRRGLSQTFHSQINSVLCPMRYQWLQRFHLDSTLLQSIDQYCVFFIRPPERFATQTFA